MILAFIKYEMCHRKQSQNICEQKFQLTSDMLCCVERKMSIWGLILGFMTVEVNCVKPKSTTSLNRVATAPRSDKQL